jgi:predicted ATPase
MEDLGRGSGSSEFGMLLRRYRIAAGFSQEALAGRARMSVNGIGSLERGDRRTPQRETLALLTRALALDEAQREEFEAAATRAAVLRRHGSGSIMAGPWLDEATFAPPMSLTRFVGRQAEIAEIARLVGQHRFVSITGAGGVGKTQTALRAARTFAGDASVCFVGLAPIRNPSLVTATIALALGVQEVPHRPLLDTLRVYLKSKSVLLILDNCEHVIAESARVADTLLLNCAGVRILATSRELLKGGGERAYRLPSLSAAEAIELFDDRARAADVRFALGDQNADLVAELCRRLDGIPLAIELAASRLNMLSVKALAEKLNDRFKFLSGGARMALPRQQTMRATIDWSYNLLAARERRVFERLSIFAGGCTLDTAAAVCVDTHIVEEDVFGLLSSLVDKSLLVADVDASEPRYRLLESSKDYAREKLCLRGEQELIAERHACAYLELAERLDAGYDTEPERVWREFAFSEQDNWRSALDWALAARGNVATGQRLAGELNMLWVLIAPVEGCRWLNLALDLADAATPAGVVAKITYARAQCAGQLETMSTQLRMSQNALSLYKITGDESGIALSKANVGRALVGLGRVDEAEPILLESLQLARRVLIGKSFAYVLRVLGHLCNAQGKFSTGRRYLAEGLTVLEEIGAPGGEAVTVASDLANLEHHAGNAELAFRLAFEQLPRLRGSASMTNLIVCINYMSEFLISLTRYEEAATYACEALDMSSELQSSAHVAGALGHCAAIVALRSINYAGSRARAARLYGYVNARLATLGNPRSITEQAEYERALTSIREGLSADSLTHLMDAGAALSEEQAIAEALQEFR